MNAPLFIISFYVALNLLLGMLFQNTIQFRCYTELIIVAASSFLFWLLIFRSITSVSDKWHPFQNIRHFLIQTGIGLSAGLINILITSGIMFLIVFNCAECSDPRLDLLNGSFTNNVAIHLLCYFTLVFTHQHKSAETPETETTDRPSEPVRLNLSSGNKTYRCPISDILYLETSNNCIIIHTSGGNFVRYQSLKSFLEKFSDGPIKRVHRSFAVNMDQVRSYEKNKNSDGYLLLSNGSKVKFSRSYLSNFA